MALKKNDVVELSYSGFLSDGSLFDTTDEILAKEKQLWNEHAKYGKKHAVLGKGALLLGLEESLFGKELGKHSITLSPEKAFGKVSTALHQLIPTGQFSKQGIRPYPGLRINIDDSVGTVRTVSGGRTVVDFNHPLAGKEVKYEVEVHRVITDGQEKTDILFNLLGVPGKGTVVGDHVELTTKEEVPETAQKMLEQEVKELVGKSVKFLVEKKEIEKKEETKEVKDDSAQKKNAAKE